MSQYMQKRSINFFIVRTFFYAGKFCYTFINGKQEALAHCDDFQKMKKFMYKLDNPEVSLSIFFFFFL